MSKNHQTPTPSSTDAELDELRARCEKAEAELAIFKDDIWSVAEVQQALEAVSRTGSEFVIHMDHRVRTSLSGLMGMVELLQNCDLDENEVEFASGAYEAGMELTNMLNDILEYCRMDAGHVSFEPESLPCEELLLFLGSRFESQVRQGGVTFESHLGSAVPPRLIVDKELLAKALRHLIDNAIRFAPGSHVELRFEIQGQREDARFCMTVTDTGPGIAQDDLARVCEAFETAHDDQGHGVGLGLTIVRRLAEMMGGEFHLTSEVGKGTSATLSFGASEVTDDQGLAEMLADTTERGQARILVIEDNVVNQRVALGFLRMLGCEAETADNGLKGVEALASGDYDLVLMDCMMPECDGYEATRRIRSGEAGEAKGKVPIVALTVDDSADARQNCLRSGMDDYMTKPVRIDRLRSMLRIWLPPALRPAAD